jgi:dihydroorotate dehydrogenase (fumarate)
MLSSNIGKIDLSCCIMNASGVHCITKDNLDDLNDSISGAIVTKSTTLEPRDGNPKPRYYDNDVLSINSSGLPNLGYKFYINIGNFIDKQKPYIVSVSGMSEADNINIIKEINECTKIDGIELNLSCPNIIGKPQIGYDFEAMNRLLNNVNSIIHPRLNFGIKLPPYFDIIHFEMAANIINKYNIDTITCINSLGNGLVIDPLNEQVVIAPKNGHGGIGGYVVKSIALSNVRKFYELTNCKVIGCGGIRNGVDAFEHILCGASAIQIGTQLYKESIPCFKRISDELLDIMNKKGYNKLDDFRGKLKYIV